MGVELVLSGKPHSGNPAQAGLICVELLEWDASKSEMRRTGSYVRLNPERRVLVERDGDGEYFAVTIDC